MVHDSQRLNGLLTALQDATSCQGFEALAQRNHNRDRRTLYRWRQSFGRRLQVVPTFTLERLGLTHLHLVITNPGREWFRFPYAVEHAWLTPDLVNNQLYLHCVVPRVHKADVRALVRECRAWCTGITLSWTEDGWQELPGITVETAPVSSSRTDDAVMREEPLVVPVVFEAWNAESMNGIWTCIRERVRDNLRQYLRRGKIYGTNGKLHVRQTYERLSQQGLFRQYLVRYEGWRDETSEVIIFLRHANDWMAELAEAVRSSAAAMEAYSGDDGTVVVRIAGNHELLHSYLALQNDLQRYDARFFLHNPRCPSTPGVRFCYEFLFDPRTGSWSFPHDTIINYMRSARE